MNNTPYQPTEPVKPSQDLEEQERIVDRIAQLSIPDRRMFLHTMLVAQDKVSSNSPPVNKYTLGFWQNAGALDLAAKEKSWGPGWVADQFGKLVRLCNERQIPTDQYEEAFLNYVKIRPEFTNEVKKLLNEQMIPDDTAGIIRDILNRI